MATFQNFLDENHSIFYTIFIIVEVISGECNESRITELQPVEVTVGASSLVHSIQKKYSRDSNSCSPTILHPVNETGNVFYHKKTKTLKIVFCG